MNLTSILTDFNLVLVAIAAAFASGVVLSTKVKDYIKGVPGQARAAINNVEADALAKLKQAQADVLAKLPGAAPAAKVALAPADMPLPAATVAAVAAAVAAAPAQAPIPPAV